VFSAIRHAIPSTRWSAPIASAIRPCLTPCWTRYVRRIWSRR
jgi:hypothetical protein